MTSDAATAVEPGRQTAGVGAFALWFALLGGIVAWSVHFWTVYMLVEIGCRSDFPGFSLFGVGGLPVLLFAATIAFGALAVAAVAVSLHIKRRLDEVEPRPGLAKFIAETGVLFGAVFLVAIVLEIVPVFVLRVCG